MGVQRAKDTHLEKMGKTWINIYKNANSPIAVAAVIVRWGNEAATAGWSIVFWPRRAVEQEGCAFFFLFWEGENRKKAASALRFFTPLFPQLSMLSMQLRHCNSLVNLQLTSECI